jgi:hypothetical protein
VIPSFSLVYPLLKVNPLQDKMKADLLKAVQANQIKLCETIVQTFKKQKQTDEMQGILDPNDYPLLNICAKYNRIEIMKVLIEAGLNVNAKDKVTTSITLTFRIESAISPD